MPHLFVPRGLTCSHTLCRFSWRKSFDFALFLSLLLPAIVFVSQSLLLLLLVLLLLPDCLSTLPGVLIYCGLVKCRQRLHFNPLSCQRFVHFCRVPFVPPNSRGQRQRKDLRGSDCGRYFWGQSMKIVPGVAHTPSNAGLKTQTVI